MGRFSGTKAKPFQKTAFEEDLCSALIAKVTPQVGKLVRRAEVRRQITAACRAVARRENPARSGVVIVLPNGKGGVKHFISKKVLQALVEEVQGTSTYGSEPPITPVPAPGTPRPPSYYTVGFAGPIQSNSSEEIGPTAPVEDSSLIKKLLASGGRARRPRPGAQHWRTPGGWAGIQCRCTFERHMVEGAVQMAPTTECSLQICWSPWCPRALLPSANLISKLRSQCQALMSTIDNLIAMNDSFPGA